VKVTLHKYEGTGLKMNDIDTVFFVNGSTHRDSYKLLRLDDDNEDTVHLFVNSGAFVAVEIDESEPAG
jgi:hypothetical protein